jgi:hypothetical protein
VIVGTEYRTGPQLISLFNTVGFDDDYRQGFTSRYSYTNERLNECNGTAKLDNIILSVINPVNFIGRENDLEGIIDVLNKYLVFDGYKIELGSKRCRILHLGNNDVQTANFYELSDEFVQEQIQKCEDKLARSDADGCITNARSLVESVLGCIYNEITGEYLKESGDLRKDYKQVRDLLKMSPEIYPDESVQQLLNALTSIVSGIDSVSNKMGDRHRRKIKPAVRHARLVTNCAKTIAIFLIESHRYQHPDN